MITSYVNTVFVICQTVSASLASCFSECADGGSGQQPLAWDPQHPDRDGGRDGGQPAGSGPGQLPDYTGGGADLAAVGRGCPRHSGWGVGRCGGSQRAVSYTRGRRRPAGWLKACRDGCVHAHVDRGVCVRMRFILRGWICKANDDTHTVYDTCYLSDL